VRKLTVSDGAVYAGDAADKFVTAEPFKFLAADGK
jgi:hypothetical protein